MADVDGDGDTDLVASNWSGYNVSVLLNNGDGTFAPQTAYNAGRTPSGLALRDVDKDGYPDIVVTNEYDDTISILRNNGDGTFAARTVYPVGDYPLAVTIGDLNGDGELDVLVCSQYDQTVSLLLGNGDGTFAPRIPLSVGNNPRACTLDDFDNDGDSDLAVLDTGDANVLALLNLGLYPRIADQPGARYVVAGEAVELQVTAMGVAPLAYQWRRAVGGTWVVLSDNGRISGAATDTLRIEPTELADAGTYDVLVTNECGEVTSQPISMTVGELGDLNCNYTLGFDDITPFVLVLTSPAQWHATYPGCPIENGDINRNGSVGFDDINPFVALFTRQ
jgi:hypothetical protein